MNKDNLKIIPVAILAAILTIASLSVAGLLQSTERLGTSGIIIESSPSAPTPSLPPAPSPPPPEPAVEIDVYADLACTTILTSIEWGEIEAGSFSNTVIYIKNNGDTDVILGLSSDNWTPAVCESYSTLSWDYDYSSLSPGEVLEVTLQLDVDSDSPPANVFSFDVIIIGS